MVNGDISIKASCLNVTAILGTKMKVILLAGGMGTRLHEETTLRPKPMVEIGSKPILWHIMKIYEHFGFSEFAVALGYKGEVIKDYFRNFYESNNDLTVDLATGKTTIHTDKQPRWRVHLIDTGLSTLTGGRINRLQSLVGPEAFMVTYGDGLANVNIQELVSFHRSHGKIATVTAVRPPARFGGLEIKGDVVSHFTEKPQSGEGWINGGYFVFEPEIFNFIDGDQTFACADGWFYDGCLVSGSSIWA